VDASSDESGERAARGKDEFVPPSVSLDVKPTTITVTHKGFSILESVLSPQECDSLAKVVRAAARGRAGARNLMSDPGIASLAIDSRMLRIASDCLGTRAVPFRATLFDKSAVSNWHVCWHQDRALPLRNRNESCEWGPWSTKAGVLYALGPAWALDRVVALRIHLDASTDSNGPLRVIPRSHRLGVIPAAEIPSAVSSGQPTTCIVGQGGVVTMRPLLLHSSTKANDNTPRRVVHIEYADSLALAPDVQLRVA